MGFSGTQLRQVNRTRTVLGTIFRSLYFFLTLVVYELVGIYLRTIRDLEVFSLVQALLLPTGLHEPVDISIRMIYETKPQ